MIETFEMMAYSLSVHCVLTGTPERVPSFIIDEPHCLHGVNILPFIQSAKLGEFFF